MFLFTLKPPASFLQAMEEYVRDAPRVSVVHKDQVHENLNHFLLQGITSSMSPNIFTGFMCVLFLGFHAQLYSAKLVDFSLHIEPIILSFSISDVISCNIVNKVC